MRPVWVVSGYFAFVFLGGALLAPWVYHAVHGASGFVPGFGALAAKPFPRYVNRSLLILALLGLGPFLRAAQLNSWRDIGLPRRAEAVPQVLRGFLFGLGSLALVVAIALGSGARQLAHDIRPFQLVTHVAGAALTAILVACLEEVVFRGALFGTLRKTFHWILALVLSSALYAALHFLERPGAVDRVGWTTGLTVLWDMFAGFTDPEKIVPGFFNLFIVGIILGLAYQRTGSLHFSIGLHAGWIFWLKTYAYITQDTPGAPTWFFGTGRLVNGWLAFIILGAFLALLTRLLVENNPQAGWREKRLLS
jgi:membrane protease YdiL (CAAX protease family)